MSFFMSSVNRYMSTAVPQSGIKSIQRWEKCRLKAYLDSGGVPTIGWGHTSGVKLGQVWTQEQCDQTFEVEVGHFWRGVYRLTSNVYSTEPQLGAMLSLAYNIGLQGFKNSSILRHHRARDYGLAADSFLLWVKDNGVFIQGLYNRRVVERNLYLSTVSHVNN